MRAELAGAVKKLFAVDFPDEIQSLTTTEIERLEDVVKVAALLRGYVDRDRYSREIEMVRG
jgi:hypothetical protein